MRKLRLRDVQERVQDCTVAALDFKLRTIWLKALDLPIISNDMIFLATQSAVHGPAASASAGRLFIMQTLRPQPDLLSQNLHFNMVPR